MVKALVTGGAGFAGGTCRSGCSPPATRKIHHRRLGKIGFRPAAHATTQDPDNLPDSYRQVLRWHLGFWQTLRRHGLWRSGFCAALVLFVAEVLLASLGLLLLAVLLVVAGGAAIAGQLWTAPGWVEASLGLVAGYGGLGVLLFLVLPDYLLTCLTALAFRRPSLLLYGVGFLVLRVVDATATLAAIPMAWRYGAPASGPARPATTWVLDHRTDPT